MRIAYVEDNVTNLALVQRIAQMNNHTVVSYLEGEIALRELSHQKFDLILMDVELAGEMNGLQVVRALRARGLTTPIVAVTAYAMMGDREKCLEAGCNDYLPKPLPIADFLMLLARYDALMQTHASPEVVSSPAIASIPAATTPTAPLVEVPRVTIVEPHVDPVAANADSLPIHIDPPDPVIPPPLKPGVGQPGVPVHTGRTGPLRDASKTSPKPPSKESS